MRPRMLYERARRTARVECSRIKVDDEYETLHAMYVLMRDVHDTFNAACLELISHRPIASRPPHPVSGIESSSHDAME
jgi:hypothetical protein